MNAIDILKRVTRCGAQISLQENEVTALSLFNQSKPVTTFDLKAAGIKGTAQCIHRLKNKGAIFNKRSGKAVDSLGVLHHGIAHYKLVGWN